MEEETKTNQTTDAEQDNNAQQEAEKTFTQEEVNNLLAKERRKLERKVAKTQEQPAAESDNPDTVQQTQQLNRELLEAKAQVEAFKSGIAPEVAEDAVYLAIREAEKSGDELDTDTIREALKIVLKRHPEWNAKEKAKGIKLGATSNDKQSGEEKALPKGTVIF